MDYQKIYDDLICHAKEFPLSGYTEVHHIIPVCLGGDNSKNNLVKLSARQHFIAHHLLYKIHKTPKLCFAWYNMCRVGKAQEARTINSKHFAKVKAIRSKVMSETSKGSDNHFFNKFHTEKTKLKISEANRGRKRTDEHKAAISLAAKRPKSEEHKRKIGRKGFIMLQNIHTLEIIRVSVNDLMTLDPSWVNPRKLTPETKYKCDYCSVVTIPSNLKRWHNDRCKHKLSNDI